MTEIKNLVVPDALFERMVRRANENHRAVEQEMLVALDRVFGEYRPVLTKEEMLAVADRLRAETPGTNLTEDFLRAARNQGRM